MHMVRDDLPAVKNQMGLWATLSDVLWAVANHALQFDIQLIRVRQHPKELLVKSNFLRSHKGACASRI